MVVYLFCSAAAATTVALVKPFVGEKANVWFLYARSVYSLYLLGRYSLFLTIFQLQSIINGVNGWQLTYLSVVGDYRPTSQAQLGPSSQLS